MMRIQAMILKPFHKHSEWLIFSIGLIMLAFMSPDNSDSSLCLFEWIGIEFCPGDGLGHSISYTFRGDIKSAFEAHFAGPFAILVLVLRILVVWKNILETKITQNKENNG